MRRAYRLLLAGVMLLAVGLPAAAQTKPPAKSAPAKPAASAKPATPAKPSLPVELRNPMVFYLAQGEPNACGPGCDEWIVAEGEITHGTADRMRAFLKRHAGGKSPKRPIYFNSPGGLTAESLAMGRLMRQQNMTARVARTLPLDCANNTAQDCAATKRSDRTLVARLTADQGGCFSACVYAIVGARVREVAPEARLGIHASKTVFRNPPKNVIISPETWARLKATSRQVNQQAIKRYLSEMAIPPALLDAAEKIPHESIHVLSREEIVQFKIDTRQTVEGGWLYDEGAKDGAVIKLADETGGLLFRRTIVRLSCTGGKFVFGLARQIGAQEESSMPMQLVAASQTFNLPPLTGSFSNDNAKRFDVRGVVVPVRVMELAAAEDSIEIKPEPTEGKSAVVRFSTIGLASALSSLTKRCYPETAGGSELAPRQRP